MLCVVLSAKKAMSDPTYPLVFPHTLYSIIIHVSFIRLHLCSLSTVLETAKPVFHRRHPSQCRHRSIRFKKSAKKMFPPTEVLLKDFEIALFIAEEHINNSLQESRSKKRPQNDHLDHGGL
jgi:hypothetical protein